MSDRTAYLVYGFDCYEYPCAPIKAFASESNARALLDEINAYQKGRPECPSDIDPDEDFDAWQSEFETWREAHPAGDMYGRDGFDVMPIPFKDSDHD